MCAAICWSRWKRSSESRSWSALRLEKKLITMFLFRSAKDERDCARKTFPVDDFSFQLLLAFFGERVELGFAAGFGNFPFGFDRAAVFEPVKGGIQRALRNLEKIP